jgi:hypothetical protein
MITDNATLAVNGITTMHHCVVVGGGRPIHPGAATSMS